MKRKIVSLEDVKNSTRVIEYLKKADEHLGAIGYTEHGKRHATIASKIACGILMSLNESKRLAELAAIAAYLHDIGNLINRSDHGISSALMAEKILDELGMDFSETTEVMGAIGNHEEEIGDPISKISAAAIIGDKSDVHRSRVRTTKLINFDIHDRVNYAATKSVVITDDKTKTITLSVTIDTNISQVMEYFEIFLSRMIICRRAAKYLGCHFELVINDVRLL